MARLHDVGGLGIFIGRRQHRAGSVPCRNSGSHPCCRLDGHREIGRELQTVFLHHQGQIDLTAMRFSEREANQAATVACHEVDFLGCGKFGGEYQIALVFAVFLVYQNDHIAFANFLDNLSYWCDICHA